LFVVVAVVVTVEAMVSNCSSCSSTITSGSSAGVLIEVVQKLQ